MPPKLYVLVRDDLSPIQRAVQGCHAALEFLRQYPQTAWNNGTLILLRIPNEGLLKQWMERLNIRDIPHACFHEPDMGNQITALAAVHEGRLFDKLDLLEV
jgi:hypothetical protein